MKKAIIALIAILICGIVIVSLRPVSASRVQEKVRVWIQTEAPTYVADGSELSLKNTIDESAEDCKECRIFVYYFISDHQGYGMRDTANLQRNETPHLMVIRTKGTKIIEAVTDGYYDELEKRFINTQK